MSGPRKHLSDAALLTLALRPTWRLAPTERAHLEACRRCQEDAADLRLLRASLAASGADGEPSMPARLRAYNLMPQRPPARAEIRGFETGRLVHEAERASASGVRAPIGATHRVWSTASADVDVRIEEAGPGSAGSLIGQILPRGRRPQARSAGACWLAERGRDPRPGSLNESGEFLLPAPVSGHWEIWLQWGGLSLRVKG